MRTIWGALALALALLMGPGLAAAADHWTYPKTEEEFEAAFRSLLWEAEPGRYELAASSSRITLEPGEYLLRSEDARHYEFLVTGIAQQRAEAVISNEDGSERVIFEYYKAGYVTDDDWSDLDADALLEEIRANTAKSNEERAANGLPPLTVLGWLERPRYDAKRKIAFWALDAKEGEVGLVNAIAIRLARHGYHKMIWVGGRELYHGTPRILEAALEGHEYDTGYRYADYVDGDKLAGFGIASLVAASAGGSKVGKGLMAAALALAVALAKKAWILVFVGIGGVWMGVKRLFSRAAGRRPPD